MAPARNTWLTHRGFLLAAIGAAVGLGDLWRFPYLMLQYGGGAFLLVYLLTLLLVGIPVLIAELAVGRRGAADPVTGLEYLAWQEGRPGRWRHLGWLAGGTGLLLLAIYAVVGGWTVAWLAPVLTGSVSPVQDHSTSARRFAELVADPVGQSGAQALFMLLVAAVLAAGLRGFERAMRWLVPAMLLLLVTIAVYPTLVVRDLGPVILQLFRPDFSRLGLTGAALAVTQACLTLSVGCGVMLVFGAGLSRTVSLGRVAVTVAAVDTGASLLAAFAVAPLVAAGGGLTEGADLVFVSLPAAYAALPGGSVMAVVFLLCLGLVVLTSSLALAQPAIECLSGCGWSRSRAVALVSLAALGVGVAAAFTQGPHWYLPLLSWTFYTGLSRFGTGLLLPLSWLGLVLFAGWAVSRRALRCELRGMSPDFATWRWLLRYLAPGLLLASLLTGLL